MMPDLLNTPYGPVAVGLMGTLVWMLKSFKRPDTDSLWVALKQVFVDHSLSAFVSTVTYLGSCFVLFEMGQLNYMAAFGAGFMGQSFCAELLKRHAEKKLNGNGNGGH